MQMSSICNSICLHVLYIILEGPKLGKDADTRNNLENPFCKQINVNGRTKFQVGDNQLVK